MTAIAFIPLLRAQWMTIGAFFKRIWSQILLWGKRAIVTVDQATLTPEQTLRQLFPDARQRLKDIKTAFIDNLDPDAICALASRYNNGRRCHVVGSDNGSFNACFFVEFAADDDLRENTDDNRDLYTCTRWVVRIPIEPAIHQPWNKVCSEAATLQYLKNNTHIPVPAVHAYGRNENLGRTTSTHMYLITDFIAGKPLDIVAFIESSEEVRRAFYSQIIDIYAELYRHKFHSLCSLMPENTFIGPLSPALNEQRRVLPILNSATDYMKAHWENISRDAEIVDEDQTEGSIQHKLFALHHIEPFFHELSPTKSHEKGPFVLSHPDFRCDNIIVDENMGVLGIIDWEFTSTVPESILSPPSWITNHDGHTALEFAVDKLYNQFIAVLEAKSKHNDICAQLQKTWFEGVTNRRSNAFRIAYLIRRPDEISHTFTNYFRRELFGEVSDAREKRAEFFQQHPELAAKSRQRFERSQQYMKYLMDNGLYQEDEDEISLKKLQAEVDAKTKGLGIPQITIC